MLIFDYLTTEDGNTIINNYNNKKPFASFFPGIAGELGIPCWVFYVNRGQCIASFGVENKDKAIMEFFPANKAYQVTPNIGFRTFIKAIINGRINYYEPFKNSLENKKKRCKNYMLFDSTSLIIEEVNPELNIKINIKYITIPNENFPALARKVSIQNLNSKPIQIEIIDGLPCINPYGMQMWAQKNMSTTSEGWVEVINNENKIPIYKLKVVIHDAPEVDYYKNGNFAMYLDGSELLPMIIDSHAVFGENTELNYPLNFFIEKPFRIPDFQVNENFTPSAFTFNEYLLEAGIEKSILGVFGYIDDIKNINNINDKIVPTGWFENKDKENQDLINRIQNNILTFSSNHHYDNYCKQTFLDNVLRGGLPVTFTSNAIKKQIFHIYSRKHGDLERDYNFFTVLPSYYSQGNGNYRDINQNRRNDNWFNIDIYDANIKTFMNLIQLDGYNPLVLKGSMFVIENSAGIHNEIKQNLKNTEDFEKLDAFIKKPFTPGALAEFFEREKIIFNKSKKEILEFIISNSKKLEDSNHQEGYWSDHWIYNIDLIESFLRIYPDKLEDLFFKTNDYTYYQNYAWINPRKKRYIIRNGKPFQSNNVSEDHDKLKIKSVFDSIVKTNYGKGENYYTNLFAKLLCMVVNKISTLDPFGVGIELEGGKTNWNDSVNGLPGLFGSSTNETVELKRLVILLADITKQNLFKEIKVPREIFKFIKSLIKALIINVKDFEGTDFQYWDRSNTIKEIYRESVKYGIHGEEKVLTINLVKKFLKLCKAKIEHGLEKAIDPKTNVMYTYFINEIIDYEIIDDNGMSFVIPKKFKQIPANLFLQGPVHSLRVAGKNAKNQYKAVKDSSLYDKKLKMYKICEPLKGMPKELGRCTIFSPGWLENESIFLHMEYKFLLETLKAGLYNEFFEDFKNAIIPFLDPEMYGRSILENSSFIVSSANSNEDLHGTGKVARLSGSTAEFINMWLIMNLGIALFKLDISGNLVLKFNPILPKWLFNKSERQIKWSYNGKLQSEILPKNHYAFLLFGKTLVIYNNKNYKNTFGANKAKIIQIMLIDKNENLDEVFSDTLAREYAEKVRNGEYKKIIIIMD